MMFPFFLICSSKNLKSYKFAGFYQIIKMGNNESYLFSKVMIVGP